MCPYQYNPILFCDINRALSTSETIDAAVPSFILKISILSKVVNLGENLTKDKTQCAGRMHVA